MRIIISPAKQTRVDTDSFACNELPVFTDRTEVLMKYKTIDRIMRFTADREWEEYHTPDNLAKSISIEANELLECFQWSDTDYDLEHVKEELADVLVYCRNMLKK